MNTILVLKPIIDALYDDMKEYKEKTDRRIKELEVELAAIRNKRKRPMVAENLVVIDDSEDDSEDDEAFAEAARAPPASSPAPVVTQVENKKENIETTTIAKEDVKSVKMIGGKDAKEYMKEYQRTYRKKQKENTINKTNM
jgi:hypothetical protein